MTLRTITPIQSKKYCNTGWEIYRFYHSNIKTTDYRKSWFTVVLTCLANYISWKQCVHLKEKLDQKLNFHAVSIMEWARCIKKWNRQPNDLIKWSLLLWDMSHSYLTDNTKCLLTILTNLFYLLFQTIINYKVSSKSSKTKLIYISTFRNGFYSF